MNKKKIIYITSRSDFGGGPYHIDILIANLQSSYDLYIAAPLNEPYGYKWLNNLGKEKFFEIPFRSFKPGKFFKLVSFIRKHSISIVHSHGKGAGIYGRLLKLFLPGIIIIHTFHGIHIQEYGFAAKKAYILLEKFLGVFTKLFINVSNGERQVCLHNKIFKEKKSVVIYNAVGQIITESLNKTELRNQLGLKENMFIIISVARFSFAKNLPLLVDVAERLNEYNRITFLVIGDGEERSVVEELIASKRISNINLLGFKSTIREYLLASDIYFSSSLWEGMPYSLIEAAGCGLPVVATNVTGNNEVVINSENGFLYEPDNPGEAVTKILELEKSSELQNRMGENSLKIFNSRFRLKTMIDKMKEVYDNSFVVNED